MIENKKEMAALTASNSVESVNHLEGDSIE